MKAIAAMASNRVIGMDGRIPWHVPEDFRWFKNTTTGGTVVMGRKTYESLGKPLPNRRNIVISRSAQIAGVTVIHCLEDFLRDFSDISDVWIIGGAELYVQTLRFCTDLYLSVIAREVAGDAFFPDFEEGFELVGVVKKEADFEVRHYRNRNLVLFSVDGRD